MRFLIILLILLITSCFDNSDKKETSTESKISKDEVEKYSYQFADRELSINDEKILLLSIIKDIPYEKTYSVLREYHGKTDYSRLLNKLDDEIDIKEYKIGVIDSIAINLGLSKKEVASIIFSYNYELLTPDDMYERYSDEILDNYQDGRDGY